MRIKNRFVVIGRLSGIVFFDSQFSTKQLWQRKDNRSRGDDAFFGVSRSENSFRISRRFYHAYFDALYHHRNTLNHILVRHEQGAAHAAQGFARVSGEVGVCLVTSGPGATNTITGIADAMIDSTPIVVIAGQVGASF